MARHLRFPWFAPWFLGLALFLSACSSNSNDDTDTLGQDPYVNADGTAKVFAQFEPGIQVMPLPNDVVWSADADPADPAIQLPATGALTQLAPVINAQHLLGLSPNMFLTVPLTAGVDPQTLRVFVFRLDAQEAPRTEVSFQVITDRIGSAAPSTPHTVLKLLPNKPFTAGAFYGVAVKMGLKDATGHDVQPSFTMTALKSTAPFTADSPYAKFEPLRAKFNAPGGLFDGLAQYTQAVLHSPWTRDDVLVLWTFHTASVTLDLTMPPAPLAYAEFGTKLSGLKQLSESKPGSPGLVWLNPANHTPAANPVGIPASALLAGSGLPDIQYLKDIYAGVFQSPDLGAGGDQTTSVPFLIVTPTVGTAPHPVVVFQHGIGRDKTDAFAIANSLAAEGLAVLAIDAPLHGDRTLRNEQGNPIGFFTADLFADRLNLYQAAMDLWETFDLIENTGIDLDGDLTADLAAPRFLSHSLGSIIGSVFLSQDTRPHAILLSSPAAQLTNVLDESARPDLQALVSDLGYTRGKTDYYVFLNLAQWLLDPVDSAYAKVGTNPLENMLAVYALGDPVVASSSSRSFLADIGADLATDVKTVDPDDIVPGVFPDTASLGYQYGVPGKLVIHSFLLSPLFDLTEEPWYTGYSPIRQQSAWLGAQAQAAAFLGAVPQGPPTKVATAAP